MIQLEIGSSTVFTLLTIVNSSGVQFKSSVECLESLGHKSLSLDNIDEMQDSIIRCINKDKSVFLDNAILKEMKIIPDGVSYFYIMLAWFFLWNLILITFFKVWKALIDMYK